MKYGIISDVHSNLEALLSVKESLEMDGAEEVIFLGDAVGYGANPNEVLELLVDWVRVFIAGNHDMAAVGLTDINYFNPYAKEAILWTAKQLTFKNRALLKSLPYVIKRENYTFVHASPEEFKKWHYILSAEDAYRNFRILDTQVCFIGHSHCPVTFVFHKERIEVTADKKVLLEDAKRYIINEGSVGQPRDGNPMAAYALLDTESKSVEIKRVPYNVILAQQKMRRANLPNYLIERLTWGH
ncbi:MAG: metallophosphoesterase family protein [Candidatus Tectomicrobia bacterium]|uniref:Metallophosphoesterase family protein n=1 Tax=Tectimicrobiota bacterium TaxID=2528274 RepID=A0A933GNI3_UNCTE|nr:metallophosphoesterase family protein [Candidatus Tectomicrobia bacterium]